ncbi:MAG: DinB family protein [Ktedonobacteraceae bacterium]
MTALITCYSGWDDYQISLARTIARLSREQLAWRPTSEHRSAGELAQHIVEGRIYWIHNFLGEGNSDLEAWPTTPAVHENAAELVKGLEASWQMIEDALNGWSTADLAQTYPIEYNEKNYIITRQWVIWHVLAHDTHHGGELTLTLGMQGIALPELGNEGGHLSERVRLAE